MFGFDIRVEVGISFSWSWRSLRSRYDDLVSLSFAVTVLFAVIFCMFALVDGLHHSH